MLNLYYTEKVLGLQEVMVKNIQEKEENFETSIITRQLKLKAQDGKYRMTDVVDIEGMFRIIESIPSKNAEPIKQWLAHLGKTGNILTNTKYRFVWESSGSDATGNSIDLNKYTRLQMSTCVSGGIDDDSIDVIKNMIGYNSRALVLATEDNFKLFFKRFSFIGYTNCWTDANTMFMNVICLSNIKNEIKDI